MTITESTPVSINVTLPPREITIETIYKDVERLLESERKYLRLQENELEKAIHRCKRFGNLWDDYNTDLSIKFYENVWSKGITKSKKIVSKLERCINILNDNN